MTVGLPPDHNKGEAQPVKKIFTCDKDITAINKKQATSPPGGYQAQAIAHWDCVLTCVDYARVERFVIWVKKSELGKINNQGGQI